MTTPTNAQLEALAAAFDSFARRFKMVEACSTEQPLNEIDKQVLLYIADHPDCGPTDVARFLGVPTTTLTSACDRLVKRKLVERTRLESDRRAVALRLSASGQTQAGALQAAHRELYVRLLEALSREDQNELIRIVTIIAQNEK